MFCFFYRNLILFFFGLLIYIGVFFVIQNNLATVSVTQEQLVEIGKNIGKDFSQLTVDEFRAKATVVSAQTALTTFFVLSGIMLMVFAAPPIKWLAGGSPYKGVWLPTIAAVVLVAAYGVILMMPGLRSFFDLVPLPVSFNIAIVVMTLLWILTQRWVWRTLLFEKFLDMEDSIVVE